MNPKYLPRLIRCECCPRRCGVNRLAGERGFCRVGAGIPVAHAGLHFGEEPPISGTRGSGTIFFAGCNLRCVFCQNHQISQEFVAPRLQTLDADCLADSMLRLQIEGAHNINFVSPSHLIYPMADAIEIARERGLRIPIVYNSNGYDSVEALRAIRGLVDIYLPDIKYQDDEIANRYSSAKDYARIVAGALEEMWDQAGPLEVDDDGVARRGMLVRHLVLPGHLENSRKCLRTLADISPDISVSIMSQYSPQYKAPRHPAINRGLTCREYDAITEYALEIGLDNAFVQELASHAHYLPRFENERPFETD